MKTGTPNHNVCIYFMIQKGFNLLQIDHVEKISKVIFLTLEK